ncbi:MAG: metallophosphoesterase family protein [Bryobacteraceae bacterium]
MIFLNSLDGEERDAFDFSSEQVRWLAGELQSASGEGSRAVLVMHTYPSELTTCREKVQRLIAERRILLVAMGHTHYNELANDGTTVYSATRSTGQIEEGPTGFSITNLDRDVVSWRFKPLAEWPFAMITSPGDRRPIVDPARASKLVKGPVEIRAKAWSAQGVMAANLQVDAGNQRRCPWVDLPSIGSAIGIRRESAMENTN